MSVKYPQVKQFKKKNPLSQKDILLIIYLVSSTLKSILNALKGKNESFLYETLLALIYSNF